MRASFDARRVVCASPRTVSSRWRVRLPVMGLLKRNETKTRGSSRHLEYGFRHLLQSCRLGVLHWLTRTHASSDQPSACANDVPPTTIAADGNCDACDAFNAATRPRGRRSVQDSKISSAEGIDASRGVLLFAWSQPYVPDEGLQRYTLHGFV